MESDNLPLITFKKKIYYTIDGCLVDPDCGVLKTLNPTNQPIPKTKGNYKKILEILPETSDRAVISYLDSKKREKSTVITLKGESEWIIEPKLKKRFHPNLYKMLFQFTRKHYNLSKNDLTSESEELISHPVISISYLCVAGEVRKIQQS